MIGFIIFISFKLFLDATLQCLHKTSQSFMETSRTFGAWLKILYQLFEALHFLDCEQMFTNSRQCFWLAGVDFLMTLMSHCGARLNWPGMQQHSIFILPCRFDHLMLGKNVEYCGSICLYQQPRRGKTAGNSIQAYLNLQYTSACSWLRQKVTVLPMN